MSHACDKLNQAPSLLYFQTFSSHMAWSLEPGNEARGYNTTNTDLSSKRPAVE